MYIIAKGDNSAFSSVITIKLWPWRVEKEGFAYTGETTLSSVMSFPLDAARFSMIAQVLCRLAW